MNYGNNRNKLGLAITKCFYCGNDKNQIIMNTHLTEKAAEEVEKMHGKVVDMEPCDECKKYMGLGIICISCKNDDPEYRTGGWAVISEDGFKKLGNAMDKELYEQILKQRFCMIQDEVWDRLGLPRGVEINNID